MGKLSGAAKHTPLSAPPLKTEPASTSGEFKPKQAPLSNPPPHASAAAPASVAMTALLPKGGRPISQNDMFQVRPVCQHSVGSHRGQCCPSWSRLLPCVSILKIRKHLEHIVIIRLNAHVVIISLYALANCRVLTAHNSPSYLPLGLLSGPSLITSCPLPNPFTLSTLTTRRMLCLNQLQPQNGLLDRICQVAPLTACLAAFTGRC